MDLDDGVTLRAGDDPTIKNELRRAWIADRLDERLGEFGETHAVDVVCATWNANGKDVTKLNLDLEPWLRSRAAPADVYAIGAQEMVDLTVSNVALTGAQAAKRAEAWCGMIESALGPGYTKLACKHLVGCFLAVPRLRPRTCSPSTDWRNGSASVPVLKVTRSNRVSVTRA